MCSRYFLDADGNVIAFTFHVPVHDRIRRRFNIAPTQEAPIVRLGGDGQRQVEMLRWGLVPFWAKDPKIGTKMINARCEGVQAKPAFRAAIKTRRCIVPASGFFEWQGEPGHKQPFAITVPGQKLFAFAGLWECWKPPEGAPVETFTIITTDSNAQVSAIHDRMPVILPPDSIGTWLAGPAEEACKLLKPYEGEVAMRPVSKVVSNVRNDTPQCLDDAQPAWKPTPSQGSLI